MVHDVFPCTTSPCRYVGNTGAGALFDYDWTPGPKTFYVQEKSGSSSPTIPADREAGGAKRAVVSATYSWSVSGNTLTLTPIGGMDACGIRGFIWTGRWTRIG